MINSVSQPIAVIIPILKMKKKLKHKEINRFSGRYPDKNGAGIQTQGPLTPRTHCQLQCYTEK